jgi:hypothetical protein
MTIYLFQLLQKLRLKIGCGSRVSPFRGGTLRCCTRPPAGRSDGRPLEMALVQNGHAKLPLCLQIRRRMASFRRRRFPFGGGLSRCQLCCTREALLKSLWLLGSLGSEGRRRGRPRDIGGCECAETPGACCTEPAKPGPCCTRRSKPCKPSATRPKRRGFSAGWFRRLAKLWHGGEKRGFRLSYRG